MSATVEWDDARFRAGLAQAFQRMAIADTRALQRVGIRVQNGARVLCPVDTGRLRSSIQHQMGRDAGGSYVDIGTNVEYAADVEFGSQGRRPKPYLRPALLQTLSGGMLRFIR